MVSVSCECFQLEISATGWQPVQISHTEHGVSETDDVRHTKAIEPREKITNLPKTSLSDLPTNNHDPR